MKMVLTIDEVNDILDEVYNEFPEPLFEGLNGGVLLLEEEKPDPEAGPDVYVMGEYCWDEMGRYINIYYGSFAEVYGHRGRMAWRRELFKTLAHEFTHHLEHLGGLHALDDKDAEFMQRAMEKYRDSDD